MFGRLRGLQSAVCENVPLCGVPTAVVEIVPGWCS